jgi:hypothetical protein
MNLPFFGRVVDERFLTYRLRSTSLAGVIGGVTAILLWAYRYYVNHVLNWDLFAVALTIVGVKMSVMAWYYLTD